MESVNIKVQKHVLGEITLHVAQIVSKEQIQHYVPQKHGLFLVCSCKYPA